MNTCLSRVLLNKLDNPMNVMVSSKMRGDTMTEIKELRKRYGFTQQELADFIPVPKRTLCSWESESETASRSCPSYVVGLIAYKLAHEFPDK